MCAKENKHIPEENPEEGNIITLDGMYKEYFLDYASYVILERAVPSIEDGLKPVQRRILHSLKEKDDGRYHKVANIIGHTMQYHPHGDAAIGAALVNIGQKDLLIDPQGNWGDYRTGDSAAAPRYIESRLTKFALEVAFNKQTTEWQTSYDGRNKEPVNLPMKFPLLLAQGVEGIAVGLSTKIMPHNFQELIKASIKILEGKPFKIYPDFMTGGSVDVSEYKRGKRGGKIKVRSKIEIRDKKFLAITELPYGVTTTSLIESIVKANDKGQIKIKKIVDNTAKYVEILIELAPGISPEVTLDALYAFTSCEVSISPNACVIIENKPQFITVNEILETSTAYTKDLLKQELEIKQHELEEKWHNSSLEKIFIEKRIYRDIEEAESFEEVIKVIDKGLKKYFSTPSDKAPKSDKRIKLHRDITEEDIARLTEIRIKRISKYNVFKAEEQIKAIEEELVKVRHDLAHLTEFAIAYFERLLEKYGKGRERLTEITSFETIKPVRVVANNAKLYINYKEGFVGTSMKKDEFICDCSDMDNIIVIRKDGVLKVSRVSDKIFMGKNILHAAVWKKGDDRTTYNMLYVDGKSGRTMAKRFQVTGVTRDREYPLTKGNAGSKVHYITANPNGETEVINVQLSPQSKAHKKVFDFDFDHIDIKGRSSGGNIVTKYPVRKVTQVSVGKSSLGSIKYYIDEVSGRINTEERGKALGGFDTGGAILCLFKDGSYQVREPEENQKYEMNNVVYIDKFDPEDIINVIYFEGEKGWSMVKRFKIETETKDSRYNFLTDHKSSKLYFASADKNCVVQYSYKAKNQKVEKEIDFDNFMDPKGWKALGNKLGEFKVLSSRALKTEAAEEQTNEAHIQKEEKEASSKVQAKLFDESPAEKKSKKKPAATKKKAPAKKKPKPKKGKDDGSLNAGDTIEFDL